jgi:hypothetical protein
MKKRFLITALAAALLLSACRGDPVALDSNLSITESAVVYIGKGLLVKSCNGLSAGEWDLLRIPPGEAVFVVDVNAKNKGIHDTAENVAFSYDFVRGNEYTISYYHDGGESGRDWGVNIYRGLKSPNPKNLIAFVPFRKAQ